MGGQPCARQQSPSQGGENGEGEDAAQHGCEHQLLARQLKPASGQLGIEPSPRAILHPHIDRSHADSNDILYQKEHDDEKQYVEYSANILIHVL